jgi:tight adherence protein C
MHDLLVQCLPWAVFISIVSAVWGCASWFQRRDGVLNRLDELKGEKRSRGADSQWRSTLQKAAENAPPIVAQALIVRDEREAERLRMRLHHAGYHAPHAVAVYMALRAASTIACGVLGAGVGLAVWRGINPSLLGCAAGILLGALTPSMVLSYLGKQRQDRIFLALPDALDLLIIAVEVGQGFDAAIQRVTREITATARELASMPRELV